jgi:hypothetical protein
MIGYACRFWLAKTGQKTSLAENNDGSAKSTASVFVTKSAKISLARPPVAKKQAQLT